MEAKNLISKGNIVILENVQFSITTTTISRKHIKKWENTVYSQERRNLTKIMPMEAQVLQSTAIKITVVFMANENHKENPKE